MQRFVTPLQGKAQLTLKCDDLFNTSTISTQVRYGLQNVKNHYMRTTRTFGISFNYKFGGYKEKKRGRGRYLPL